MRCLPYEVREEAALACKAYRERHGLTQITLAIELETGPNTISGIENMRPFTSKRVIRDLMALVRADLAIEEISPVEIAISPRQSI